MSDTNEHDPESLQDILSRMGEKFFVPQKKGEVVEHQRKQEKPLPNNGQTSNAKPPNPVYREAVASAETTPDEQHIPPPHGTTSNLINDTRLHPIRGVFRSKWFFHSRQAIALKIFISKKRRYAKTLTPTGKKRILKTKISANYELGLPVTSDLDYYRAFLKICDDIVDQDGRFQLPIAVPSSN